MLIHLLNYSVGEYSQVQVLAKPRLVENVDGTKKIKLTADLLMTAWFCFLFPFQL
jgi:hypothetical protein